MRWVDAVVAEYTKYANWPIASLKLDDLYASYQARETRDACDLGYTLDVDAATSGVSSITLTSAAAGGSTACSAPLMTKAGAASFPLAAGGSSTVGASGLTWSVLQAA